MSSDAPQQRRKSTRLANHNYQEPGSYFITICSHNKAATFSTIKENSLHLSIYGEVIEQCWQEIPEHFRNTRLDSFVIMPNHIHGVIHIDDWNTSKPIIAESMSSLKPSSLGSIIASFKSASTKYIRKRVNDASVEIWQRNYYDRVIRNEKELLQVRQYIEANPLKWREDLLYLE
ncbi:MAG TPA: transposase [Candidatus Kapabacteria bacterium]|nr:transposase [Candidatus Kapabacteria bacterium]